MKAQDHRLVGGGLFLFSDTDRRPIHLFSYRKEYPMPPTTSIVKRYSKPALVTSAGGTSLLLWFEEIIAIGLDFLVCAALLLVVGPIYLFNHFMFKSATPRREDKYK
jgi:hypothetical protein